MFGKQGKIFKTFFAVAVSAAVISGTLPLPVLGAGGARFNGVGTIEKSEAADNDAPQAPGEAIICIRPSVADEKKIARESAGLFSAGPEISSKELMDVSEAAERFEDVQKAPHPAAYAATFPRGEGFKGFPSGEAVAVRRLMRAYITLKKCFQVQSPLTASSTASRSPVSPPGLRSASVRSKRTSPGRAEPVRAKRLPLASSAPRGEGLAVLKLVHSDSMSTEELIELYSGKPGVLFAEPNYIVKADSVADSGKSDGEAPILGTTENVPDLTPAQYAYGDGPGGIDVPGWGSTGEKNADEDTVIAVIDTGVDYENEDLKSAMWDKGEDYPELTALGGGKYGIYTAADHYEGELDVSSNDPMDFENGHGTHCAGIAAAPWNGYGISGTANGAKIMAVDIYFDRINGNAYNSDIVEGFNYVLTAKKAGVKVASANCSFGSPLKSLSTACCARELGKNGVVTCFSSGNYDENTDGSYRDSSVTKNDPSVIIVDYMDQKGNREIYSDYGIRSTHIFAPGTDILSTVPNALSYPIMDSRISKPVATLSGNELYDDYHGGVSGFDYEPNTANGTKIEFKDGGLVISGTDLSKVDDSITKEIIAENEKNRVAIMTIKPRGKLKNLEEGSKYNLVMKRRARSFPGVYWYILVYVKTKDGKWERPAFSEVVFDYPGYEYCPLDVSAKGNAFDLDDLEIRLALSYLPYEEIDTPVFEEAVIDEFWITDAPEYHYGYKSGTSMATPAVTGEVAVLAKYFPDDSAAKRAARVLAGARQSEVLKELCVTGGTANVRNSLDENTYTPVVNGIFVDNKGLHIEGFFLGDKSDTEVSMTQGGVDYSTSDGSLSIKSIGVSSGDTEEILLEVPQGLKSNEEVYLTVTDKAKSAGRQRFSRYLTPEDPEGILESGNVYQRITIPEGLFSIFTIFNRAAALDGSIYFTGYDTSDGHDYITPYSRFDTFRFKEGEWEKAECAVSANGCIAAFNGELVYADYFDNKMLCFYDGKGNIRKKEFIPEKGDAAIPEDRPWILEAPDVNNSLINLYYDGKDMILIRNTFISEENDEGAVHIFSSVYKLDPLSGKGTYLGDLKNGYSNSVVIAHEEISGKPNRIYVIGKGIREGSDEINGFAAESFTVDDFSPKTLNDAAPQGCYFHNDRTEWSGCGVKNGIYLTGPRSVEEDGAVTKVNADNYFFSFKDPGKGFQPCGKKICDTTLEFPVAVSGYGKVYFLGINDTGYIMGCTDEDTYPHYGDSAEPEKEPEKVPGLSDPASPLHRTDGDNIESVSADNAKYEFDLKKNPAVVSFTKADISSAFESFEGYDPAAKHRYISSDKKKAKVNKKGILSAKDRGEVDITLEQKVKGGSWTKMGEPLHLYLQLPEMRKKFEAKTSDKGLSAYSFLSKTSYSPTKWVSTNTKVAEVDENGVITIHKKGSAGIIAEYGEGKNGSKKKFKTKLKVIE